MVKQDRLSEVKSGMGGATGGKSFAYYKAESRREILGLHRFIRK